MANVNTIDHILWTCMFKWVCTCDHKVNFIFVVDGGERALIFDKFSGLRDKVYGEGMHFKLPIIQVPKYFEIRTRYFMLTSTTGTRDLQ